MSFQSQSRPARPRDASEEVTLLGFLNHLRATISWKCSGLTDEQLHAKVTTSTMTLGGMLHHLARVEDWWCTTVVGQRSMPEPWNSVDRLNDPDWDWRTASTRTGEELRSFWEERVAASQEVLTSALARSPDALAVTYQARTPADQVSLRWVLVHLIEEYARHCGHADLIRETIDGQVGA